MLKIKDLKSKQRIWHEKHGRGEIYTVFGSPMLVDGKWLVDTTDDGDYCWTFHEVDEEFLHLEGFNCVY